MLLNLRHRLLSNHSVLINGLCKNANNMCLRRNDNETVALDVQERKTFPLVLNELPVVVSLEDFEKEKDHMLTYIDIVKYITREDDLEVLNEAKQRLAKALRHSVPYGRQFEGIGLLNSYRLIETPENLTSENIKLAQVMSWCTAMQGGALMIQDDMMDGEQTRKNLTCWYTSENIGMSAINDSLMIENAIYKVLKKYFSNHHCYVPAMELIHATSYNVGLGQTIDASSKLDGRPRFEDFTTERLEFMSYFKSACYSYEEPVKLALYLAGNYDPELHSKVSSITSKIGVIFMIHNDMQDTFGITEVTGRTSTDVRNGRCTWMAVEALKRGTSAQKLLFMENYGKHCIQSEQKVHNLYRELKLDEVYLQVERNILNEIESQMESISHQIPKQVFHTLLTDVTSYRKGYCYS